MSVLLQDRDGMSSVLQDFEIAGSGTGALNGSAADCAEGGGCECETPIGTINSWDSHSHYRRHAPSPDISLYSGVIVYCDHKHLRTPTGIIRVLLMVSTTEVSPKEAPVEVREVRSCGPKVFLCFRYTFAFR